MKLYQRALKTALASRFAARSDDLGRELTDEETREEARYQYEDLPYKGIFEGRDLANARRQMKRLFESK